MDTELFAQLDTETENPNPALTFQITRQPLNGALPTFQTSTGEFNYMPQPGFIGTDTFEFKVTSADGLTDSAMVKVHVLNKADLDYDIVYVRQPRGGDYGKTYWPEVFHPGRAEPGADLMLLHPDGTEEVLVNCDTGSVTDPYVSFDGEWVYYSLFHDLHPDRLNRQREELSYDGADIFRINVNTREVNQLTFGEFTPNTGAGNWDESNPVDPDPEYNRLGYGIMNLGPCPLPGGKIAFTSNRNGFLPNKQFTYPNMQLFVMDEDGRNVTQIAPMTIGSSLHPTILRDGRLIFSSYEAQGVRDKRLWGVWSIYPDGRNWGPIVSAFKLQSAFHFYTQLSNGDLVIEDYYNGNNNGFGAFYRMPLSAPPGTPPFYSADLNENPDITMTLETGVVTAFRMPFTPWGMYSITPMTHARDDAAPESGAGGRVGKFTHPSAGPDNDLLAVWSAGPANDLNRPTNLPRYDSGLYLFEGSTEAWSATDLQFIKNDPNYNEAWPRALVPYSDVHGVAEPDELPWLPNDGSLHTELPAGTADGLVGTSSFYKRETAPSRGHPEYDGLDEFNTMVPRPYSNWLSQGGDAGKYTNEDIWAVRVLAMEPNTHRSYGPNAVGNFGFSFFSHANERLRIMGEIPLRKFNGGGQPILDPEGNPDTSFLAKLPADTPFTFQTIDRNGMVLNMAQTWHQVRPGEMRVDCGGCHAHSSEPLAFEDTEASLPGFDVYDLSKVTPMVTGGGASPGLDVRSTSVVNVEFYEDIRPILQSHCVSCHTKGSPNPPGDLVLDDYELYDGLPGDYKRLAADSDAEFGYPAVVKSGTWRNLNASRYVRMFQARRSLLVWKVFGERLDGWTNADHPTETVPGDPATLPAGADPNVADLDFTGTIMPPPGSGVPALTMEQKMLFARWIDLGAPINSGVEKGDGDFGWFLDDLRPTVAVSLPRAGVNSGQVTTLRFAVSDANSGVNMSTLSVKADFPVNGRAPGSELADLVGGIGYSRYTLSISPPTGRSEITVSVEDNQGNVKRVKRSFIEE